MKRFLLHSIAAALLITSTVNVDTLSAMHRRDNINPRGVRMIGVIMLLAGVGLLVAPEFEPQLSLSIDLSCESFKNDWPIQHHVNRRELFNRILEAFPSDEKCSANVRICDADKLCQNAEVICKEETAIGTKECTFENNPNTCPQPPCEQPKELGHQRCYRRKQKPFECFSIKKQQQITRMINHQNP